MEWRVYIMSIAGVAMIYLTSLLLYDVPYPTPVYIPHVEKSKNGVSDQVILTAKKDYIYNTQLVFDQERSESYFYSTSALKVGTFGIFHYFSLFLYLTLCFKVASFKQKS